MSTPPQRPAAAGPTRTEAQRPPLAALRCGVAVEPETGLRAWLRTTTGLVALLLVVQFATGFLLACYYVPATESAHTTVAFIEQSRAGGAWLRALHVTGSVVLPCLLLLHLGQRLWRGRLRRRPVGWLFAVTLLALTLAAAGTGYTLPWDARAYYTTHVAAGLVGGLPLVGPQARLWLLGGPDVSTLTLSRFFALHILALPFLILLSVGARLFLFRANNAPAAAAATHPDAANDAAVADIAGADKAAPFSPAHWLRAQLVRNAVAAGLGFAVLAFYALKYPAPFGPRADAAPPEYLPRPGAQFLWLFELLKHTANTTAALAGLVLPALLLIGLALLPWLATQRRLPGQLRRAVPVLLFILPCALVLTLTTVALIADRRDPRVRAQLARQAAAEATFRRAPFVPQRLPAESRDTAQTTPPDTPAQAQASAAETTPPPAAYTQQCAKCHGARGEGVRPNPKLIGIAAQPQRTVADLIAILNDPAAYGLAKPMNSFADKLSAAEKQQIATWIAGLK